MASINGLFRRFHVEARPLALELERRHLGPLVKKVSSWDADDLNADTAELVTRLLESARLEPPRLLGMEIASSRDGDGDWRPGEGPGRQVATNRHNIAIEVDGEVDLLNFWPDEATGLSPIDDFDLDPWEEQDSSEYSEQEAIRRHKMRQTNDLWQIRHRTDDGPLALYTFVDLTYEEERLVEDGRLDVREEVDENRKRIEPIVAAIHEHCRSFAETHLPERLRKSIEDRKVLVSARSAVRSSLSWPEGWRGPAPALSDEPEPRTTTESATADAELDMPSRARLSAASFELVLRIIRVWADSIERHPEAFRTLREDHLSDLLVATLNANLPGANREVYSRGGKSDIFVRADVLSEGRGPAKIFICESKWWSGKSDASKAVTQLLGYLEAKDTSTVLIFFVRNKDPHAVRAKAVEEMEARQDFEERRPEVVDGWPTLRLIAETRAVDMSIAFVDLPAT